jgi:hypothetical protein
MLKERILAGVTAVEYGGPGPRHAKDGRGDALVRRPKHEPHPRHKIRSLLEAALSDRGRLPQGEVNDGGSCRAAKVRAKLPLPCEAQRGG